MGDAVSKPERQLTDYEEIVRLRTKLARFMEEVEAWRAVMPQYEYRDGAIHRTLASLPPSASN